MFEGKEITVVHPSGEIDKGIIVGCDIERGVTVINSEKPEDIILCYQPNNYSLHKEWIEWFIETIKKEKEWDIIKELIKRKKIDGIMGAFLRVRARYKGTTKEELHKICPFK